jgi:hypothetical protein
MTDDTFLIYYTGAQYQKSQTIYNRNVKLYDRVLRTIFGPRRDDVMGGRRKSHNEEFHNLYCSPNTLLLG